MQNLSGSPLIPIEKLRYEIFPTRFLPSLGVQEAYNRCFDYWTAFWTDVMVENGTDHEIDRYEFLKTDLVSVISYETQPVAMLLHSFLNFEQKNVGSHPYLRSERCELFFKYVEKTQSKLAMSVEYLTVDRAWRKSRTGLSLSKVMFGLGSEIQKTVEADVSFFKAREDVKVSRSAEEYGGLVLQSQVSLHNTPVAFVALPLGRICTHPDPSVATMVAALWSRRNDHSKLTHSNKIEQAAA